MAPCAGEWITACSNIILSATALHSSYKLFKDHRAPSLGLFLVAVSTGLCVLPRCVLPSLGSLHKEAEWASELLAPALVSFHLLWLSEDRNTAFILLSGACLLAALCDSLSADALAVLSRCLGLSSLSCCLTVCLFAGNALGAVSGVALSLPLLVNPGLGANSLVSPAVSEEILDWPLKGLMSVGCWLLPHAMHKFLLDVTER